MIIAVGQRMGVVNGEIRDSLDRRWGKFLHECGINFCPIPNDVEHAARLVDALDIGGVLLTGGEHLGHYSGGAMCGPRDHVELFLYRYACEKKIPLFGVCRGMQFIQHSFGIHLEPVKNHVSKIQEILIDGKPEIVNSYHTMGATASIPSLEVFAVAADGVIKGIRHREMKIAGIMWHPERMSPFEKRDIDLVKKFFMAEGAS